MIMKKFLLILVLVFCSLNLSGCWTSTPPWGSKIDKGSIPSSYSCDQNTGNKETALSRAAYFLIDPIVTQVQSISILIFNNIINHTVYKRIINAALILYLVIYGIMFASGLVQAKLSDLIGRLTKIGIVLTLLTKTAYSFFNDYLFRLFTDGSYSLLATVTNPYCNTRAERLNFFAFFNHVVDTIINDDFLFRLSALIFAYPVGWLCFVILIRAIIKYLFAVLKAIIAYLFAFTAVALLISLAPIFIALILFEKTRPLFDNWIKAVIMFAFQPVILFSAIIFVTLFINEALQSILVSCSWRVILPVYINFGMGIRLNLFSLYWYVPDFIAKADFSAYLDYCAALLVFHLSVTTLESLPAYVEGLCFKLIGGGSAVSATKDVTPDIPTDKGISETAKGLVGKDKDSKARRKSIGDKINDEYKDF
jgi:type IV secretory pathway VirB6-like protein